MTSSFREGGDIALWLHNKLGSSDDNWSSHTITGQLNPDVLKNIQRCFETLQPNVKVKILLSFLHLPRRQLDEAEWRQELNSIIEIAGNDTDQWVVMVADLMKSFPNRLLFNLEEISEQAEEPFGDVLKDLMRVVKKSTDRSTLPLEFQFLGKQALASAVGHGLPQQPRHFTIKRKPKSAALRAELLNKSEATKKSLGLGGSSIGNSAVKSRNFNEKKNLLDSSLNKMNKSGTGAFFKSPNRGSLGMPPRGSLASRNQNIGIKVLDIKDQPLSFKDARKRKKEEEEKDRKERDSKKEKLSAPRLPIDGVSSIAEPISNGARAGAASKNPVTTTAPPNATPDYAASLGLTSTLTPVSVNADSTTSIPTTTDSTQSSVATLPDYAPKTSAIIPGDNAKPTTPSRVPVSRPAAQSTVNVSSSVLQSIKQMQQQPQLVSTPSSQSETALGVNATHAQFPTQLVSPASADVKKGLSLTKEQMLEAQDMFKTSNKVTRPEKALILGFMAGSRDNPCPEKGHILTIRLSEREEMVQPDSTKLPTLMHVETYFQMNYKTGDWKRIKKCRPLQSLQKVVEPDRAQSAVIPPKAVEDSSGLAGLSFATASTPTIHPTTTTMVRSNALPLGGGLVRDSARFTTPPRVETVANSSQGFRLVPVSNFAPSSPTKSPKSAVATPPAPYNANASGMSKLLAVQNPIRTPSTATQMTPLPNATSLLRAPASHGDTTRSALASSVPQGTVLVRAPDGRLLRASAAALPQALRLTTQGALAVPGFGSKQTPQFRLATQQITPTQLQQQQPRFTTPTQMPSSLTSTQAATAIQPPRLISVSDLSVARANAQSNGAADATAATGGQTRQTHGDIQSAIRNRGSAAAAPPLRFVVPGTSALGLMPIQPPLNAATLAALQRQQLQIQQLQMAQQPRPVSQSSLPQDKLKR